MNWVSLDTETIPCMEQAVGFDTSCEWQLVPWETCTLHIQETKFTATDHTAAGTC